MWKFFSPDLNSFEKIWGFSTYINISAIFVTDTQIILRLQFRSSFKNNYVFIFT